MAEILGPLTIRAHALPTGINSTYIAQQKLKDGKTYGELVTDLSNALGLFNQEMATLWSGVISFAEESFFEYPQGGTVTDAQEVTDIDIVDETHGNTIGHGLPLNFYNEAVASSWYALLGIREPVLRATISTLVNKFRWRLEKKIMNRFFSTTENTVATGFIDVPFVNGGSGSVDFIPPAFDGQSFTSAHDHYLGVDSDTYGYADMLDQMAETLQEHGHNAPFRAWVPRADVNAYKALPRFIRPVGDRVVIIDQGGETGMATRFMNNAQMEREQGFIGAFDSNWGDIDLYATARIPSKYAGLFKSYGAMDKRNPIAILLEKQIGFGATLKVATSGNSQFPIDRIDVLSVFGAGVGRDRTNGVAGFLDASGTYTAPTIS